MKTKILRIFLIFWTLFIGIGAVAGSLMMFVSPDGTMWGLEAVLPYLQVLPWAEIFFTNLIFSGIMLLIINGVTQLIAAKLLINKNKYGALAGMICGIILIMWIVFEWILWGFGGLSNVYFVFGVLETINGAWLYLVERQASR